MVIYASGYLEDKRIQVALVQKRGVYGHFVPSVQPCLYAVLSLACLL